MTIEEILAIANSDEINKELLVSKINDYASEQKRQYTSKDKEVLKYKQAVKKLGYNSDEHTNVDSFIDVMLSKVNTTNQPQPNDRVSVLEAKLAEYETKIKNADKRDTDSTIFTKLNEAFGSKIKGSKAIIENLMLKEAVKLVDGEVVFKGKTDDEVELFDAGINKILSEYQDLLIVEQVKGSNIKGSNLSNNNEKQLSMDVINKMTPEQIKENMDAIWKLAK